MLIQTHITSHWFSAKQAHRKYVTACFRESDFQDMLEVKTFAYFENVSPFLGAGMDKCGEQ